MYDFGLLLIAIGIFLSLGGYAGLVARALKMGPFWLSGLLIVPFFSFILLFADFRGSWKWMLANFGGGVIINFGALFLALGMQAQIDHRTGPGLAPSPRPASPGIPDMPGVYIPSEHGSPGSAGFLETVDPMLLALVGGIGVFVLVGIVAGGLLIGTMDVAEPQEEELL